MENITVGEILGWLGLVAGAVTSAGVIVKAVKVARDKRRDQIIKEVAAVIEKELAKVQARMDASDAKIDDVRKSLDQNNLETARVDLGQAIEHAPHEHKAILDLAWHYFIELGGNSWMWGKFKKWADDEDVDISHITERMTHLS